MHHQALRAINILLLLLHGYLYPLPSCSWPDCLLKARVVALAGVAQVVGVPCCMLKGGTSSSRSGRMRRLRVWSQSGHVWEATNWYFSKTWMFLSLFLWNQYVLGWVRKKKRQNRVYWCIICMQYNSSCSGIPFWVLINRNSCVTSTTTKLWNNSSP